MLPQCLLHLCDSEELLHLLVVSLQRLLHPLLLRQESLKLKGEAASVMMETDADAGRRAKALLKQQRKVEEQILDQEKQFVRHQRRDRQRVACYNAIRAQLDQFEERREELQERVREGLLSDEMCEDLATLNRRVAEYKVLLADANKELGKVVDKSREAF